jgi:hypothetical protein
MRDVGPHAGHAIGPANDSYCEQQKPDLGYRFMARVNQAIEQIAGKPNPICPSDQTKYLR